MIRLNSLYSIPEKFKPVTFKAGVNLILGEIVEETLDNKGNKKTNGVGKSMMIEFIQFCFLKDYSSSRVSKIPVDVFSWETLVCLDFTLNEKNIIIQRSIQNEERPTIIVNGRSTNFSSLKDALQYMTNLIHEGENIQNAPSFRELISLMIREESSEFKNILQPHNLIKRIPPEIKPHLYFLGIDATPADNIKKILEEISKKKTIISDLKKRLETPEGKKIKDIRAEINEANTSLLEVDDALDKLRAEPAFQLNQKDLQSIDAEIYDLRISLSALRYEHQKIDSIPKIEQINIADVKIAYNRIRDGLGDLVSKKIEEVIGFKNKIEDYQNLILKERSNDIREKIKQVQNDITNLDEKRASILIASNCGDSLSILKDGFIIQSKKQEEFAETKNNLAKYDKIEREKKHLTYEKDALFASLDAGIFEADSLIRDFEKTLIEIHQYIMGSSGVSFRLETNDKEKGKQIVDFNFYIPDDGSHSIDRIKVLIYDLSLLFNAHTRKRHPLFLVHDNVFDVDQDTLVQSLNYLSEQENKTDFQYILTLCRDKFSDAEKKEIKLDIELCRRAKYTKADKFLKGNYKEIH